MREGTGDDVPVLSPTAGTVVAVTGVPDRHVRSGDTLALVEVMKTEVPVLAPVDGVLLSVAMSVGDLLAEGDEVAVLRALPAPASAGGVGTPEDYGPPEVSDPPEALNGPRADLADLLARHAFTADGARPEAVARHRERGRRTARENLADLLDPGSFLEYGPLLLAAQERRRSREELERAVPADGLVGGVGEVDGRRVVVLAYDATVLAGTQGLRGHGKLDRLLTLAHDAGLPVVLLAEGGGGRPGDVDVPVVSALDTVGFGLLGRLSGRVPLVGVASGRCFAGNAALLGTCDVVVATAGATIGLGGPAMIAGGGLGEVEPEEVGPAAVQYRVGVVDVLVDDDAAAVAAVRDHLAFVVGPYASRRAQQWSPPDSLALRAAVPERRVRAFDVRAVVRGVCDVGSARELRGGFGRCVVTALGRVEGWPVGVLANDGAVGGGALDADGADKAARFLQLCDAHGLPVLSLVDTPGFLVGPDAERTATVRHCARLFVVGPSLRVPLGAVVLRRGYGLGAQAMMGGSTRAPRFTIAWPTGEMGPMGLEGAVRLGMRRELEAIGDPGAREERVAQETARLQEQARVVHAAAYGEIDDVVDPARTRDWVRLLTAEAASSSDGSPGASSSSGSTTPRFVDTW